MRQLMDALHLTNATVSVDKVINVPWSYVFNVARRFVSYFWLDFP